MPETLEHDRRSCGDARPGFPNTSRAKSDERCGANFFVLTILLALLLGVMKPVESVDPAMAAGEHIGALLVLLVLPMVVAYLVAGRKKVRNPNRFALVFCLISGFFVLGNAASMVKVEPPRERFARLAREAAGTQPVSHKGFASQRRFDDAVRQQYGKMLQQSRDYEEKAKKVDNSKIKSINSAVSFASADAAQPGLEQLHALYEVDAEHEQEVREAFGGLRRLLEDMASPADRREMLKGFDESMAEQMNRRQQTLAAEKAWIDAVDDEYAFAQAHRDSIRVAQDKVVINDPVVRGEFNDKLSFQGEKRKAFLKVQADFNKSQAEARSKMGLSERDTGRK